MFSNTTTSVFKHYHKCFKTLQPVFHNHHFVRILFQCDSHSRKGDGGEQDKSPRPCWSKSCIFSRSFTLSKDDTHKSRSFFTLTALYICLIIIFFHSEVKKTSLKRPLMRLSGEGFNQKLDNVTFTNLTFGGDFNQRLDKMTLSEGL